MMITKDTPIIEVLRLNPLSKEIFVRHGMGCISCMGLATETIENGAKLHGINVQILLEELNKILLEEG
jgi:hybrid cluster-associated redox disulfide protein